MPTTRETIESLQSLFEKKLRFQRDKATAIATGEPTDVTSAIDNVVQMYAKWISTKLEEHTRFPPHFSRHFDSLVDFHTSAPYERSVFVMSKYPEGDGQEDEELRRIIDMVASLIKKNGYVPRIATERRYHEMLWDNVELYLLGCCKGVAIVEDRYKPELNPNVALEWGWMIGMGKQVLCLVEGGFKHLRADWDGLYKDSFSWDDPRPGIERAIRTWLAR